MLIVEGMLLLIIIVYILLFLFITSIDIPFLLQLTFVANLSLYSFMTYKMFQQKKFNPLMCTSIIFFLCFFILAPLIQLQYSYVAPNSYVIKPEIGVYANILIFIFYLILYFLQNRKGVDLTGWYKGDVKRINTTLLIISLGSIIVALPFLRNLYLSAATASAEDSSIVETLLIKKVILSFPYFCLLAFLSTNKIKFSNLGILFILILALLIAKNPLLEKRNAIGPIYLTLFYFAFSKNLGTNIKFYLSNLVIFVVFFPLSSLLTNKGTDESTAEGKLEAIESQEVELGNTIYDHFRELHYDAWSIVNVTIEYAERDGVTNGSQFLGAVMFFFPRQFWEDKPVGSGAFVGQEFIANVYGFDFFNLSSPLVAEGYINFGLVGVVLFAFLLGWLFLWWLRTLQGNKYDFLFLIYSSFYMFFLLRGDLQNAMAYFVGPLVPFFVVRMLVVPKIKKSNVTARIV